MIRNALHQKYTREENGSDGNDRQRRRRRPFSCLLGVSTMIDRASILIVAVTTAILCGWLPEILASSQERSSEFSKRRSLQQKSYRKEHGSRRLLNPNLLQPKLTRVEGGAASKVIGSISMASGSPWCPKGRPMAWFVGHQNFEQPWCQMMGGKWKNVSKAIMARNTDDRINDRHDCVTLDANKDGILDIACIVGAHKGRGLGLNELYLTRDDGSLEQIPWHGLQKYQTLSTRVAVKLQSAASNETSLIFIGTSGISRDDGGTNKHRMFALLESGLPPYFEEVEGPWMEMNANAIYSADCAVVADINADGTDDLLVCDEKDAPHMYTQASSGEFKEMQMPSRSDMSGWTNLRVGHITQQRLPDVIVVENHGSANGKSTSYLKIFQGIPSEPYFDFSTPIFKRKLPYYSPNLELVDANKDGLLDVFVVQMDESAGYCGATAGKQARYWQEPKETRFERQQGKEKFKKGRKNAKLSKSPPEDWIPPANGAPDLLFIRRKQNGSSVINIGFQLVKMKYTRHGCGGYVEQFGNLQSLLLAGGKRIHAGFNYLLEWK